ncbi:MAG TPA: transposase [Candidatus Paceibacterota bacterium]
MDRKFNFAPGEYYHVFSRGVEKRKIFLTKGDYDRFLALLYILNQNASFVIGNYLKSGKSLDRIFDEKREKTLVTILSYCLMPNHFHLLIREDKENGISKAMGKILTGYSMYFNKKYDRTGPLFVKPFRAVHVNNDNHLKHLFAYIHLNCLDLCEAHWKKEGIKNHKVAESFLNKYKFSSYSNNLPIIDFEVISSVISRTPLDIREYEEWYKQFDPNE